MKKYKVTITETLQMEVEVEAPNRIEAERLVNKHWIDGDHILDADHFIGVDFKAVPVQRERAYER
ncbi:MAG: DpnD/PcfM family protein [Eubacteriales bacterium]|nr:DpnD/PcfM family protein [Eubacteriales bacterium]